jgi:hypothetical protein
MKHHQYVVFPHAGVQPRCSHPLVLRSVIFESLTAHWFAVCSIRHHMVDSKYWLGFSVPAVDDFFGTNPTLHQWKKNQQQQQQRDSDE